MSESNTRFAGNISTKLSLDRAPIALAFVEGPPEGVAAIGREVPAACSFWKAAESSVFYASAEQHFNCPVGAMTMGFEMPPAVSEQLMELVGQMTGCGYITPEEAAKIPSIKKKKTGIVYGPLEAFPIQPDVVLLWLTPRQAMLFREAGGSCRWTDSDLAGVFGRPACAALPVAVESSEPTLSLGCAGMRTFTEISDDRMLGVVPGDKLEELTGRLDATLASNAAVQQHYDQSKAAFVS